MKVVAVSQRVDCATGRDEWRDGLDQRLVAFLAEAGMLSAPVPNVLAMVLEGWFAQVRPAGIVLSGGNDIGQRAERDQTEQWMLAWARHNRAPVLGICRGMQMLARFAGGALKPVAGHVGTRHSLQGEVTGAVNSFHNFSLAATPPGFVVTARAEDGEIEAMRHETLPWIGCMWHPEREKGFLAADLTRTRALMNGFCR